MFAAAFTIVVVAVVVFLPELPPVSRTDVVSILVVILWIGIRIVVVIVLSILPVLFIVLVLVLLIVPLLLVGHTSDRKSEEGKEERHESTNVPRQDERIAHVDVEFGKKTHFEDCEFGLAMREDGRSGGSKSAAGVVVVAVADLIVL